VTIDIIEDCVSTLKEQSHPHCVVCGRSNEHGLGLLFHSTEDGAIEASFECESIFQGYPDMLHGGVICALLDGAMTNCMFANGQATMTAELNVRFRHPVTTGNPATIRAWITSSTRPLHEVAAELIQDGQVKATAKGKFLEKSAVGLFGKAEK
jgi:uncharacterized protein (TIGR00369 family)